MKRTISLISEVEIEGFAVPNYVASDGRDVHVSNIPADTLSDMLDELRAATFAKADKQDPRTGP